MKKIITFILAAALCFSFAACSAENTGTENIFENAADYITAVVRISINPEVELYVDNAGHIADIKYLNDDAEKAFADSNVMNMYCETAVSELLNAAYNKGYLSTGAAVDVVFLEKDSSADVAFIKNDIDKALNDFKTVVDYSYSFVNNAVNDSGKTNEDNNQQKNEVTVVDFVDDLGRNVTHHINERGKIVYWRIEEDYGIRETFFDENETPLEEKTLYTDQSTSHVVFYENGTAKSTVMEKPNGYFEKMSYSPDGKCTYSYVFDPEEGAYESVETEYNSDGTVAQTFMKQSDGTTVQTIYKNGLIDYMESYIASNGYHQVFTYQNGVRISSITEGPNNFYSYWYYDSNGNPTEFTGLDNHGRPVHIIYNPDGSYVQTITTSDGSEQTEYYDANGNLTGHG